MRYPRNTMCKIEHSDPVVNMARVASAPPNPIYLPSQDVEFSTESIKRTLSMCICVAMREGTVASRGKLIGFTWVNFQALVGPV